MARTRYTKEQTLDAVAGSFGIVTKVADILRCDWHTADAYIQNWAETREAFRGEGERALDLSESKLMEAVEEGDGAMIRFHLATKGKERGFTERQEHTGKDGGAIAVTHRAEDLTDDELARIAAGGSE